MSDAWARRTSPGRGAGPAGGQGLAAVGPAIPAPDVLLVHYDDLCADLDGQMRRLAGLLGITVPAAMWPRLVRAATFGEMRAKAATQAPDPAGVLKDPAAFFRRGRPGAGGEVLTPAEVERYHARAATLASSDLLDWLHR